MRRFSVQLVARFLKSLAWDLIAYIVLVHCQVAVATFEASDRELLLGCDLTKLLSLAAAENLAILSANSE